ncbi:2-phosphosulfolactate phosphatase [Priestia megaterium]|nr:2-phosphosulfolactate phosphatase [Priestia megaterium]
MINKVHVVLKKEELQEEKLDGKTAVVFDILLATSTITAVLQEGAKAVIPVMDEAEARELAKQFSPEEIALVGEYGGKTIEGFLDPNPSSLKEFIQNKTVILSTTNGTVAIRKASEAKKVYAASLLNSEVVAEMILRNNENETILLVCSGSSGQFCLEDLYGAGYFLQCLLNRAAFTLTDAARAALLFYQSYKDEAVQILGQSAVGQMLMQYGFDEEVGFVSRKSVYSIVPQVVDGTIINEEENTCLK